MEEKILRKTATTNKVRDFSEDISEDTECHLWSYMFFPNFILAAVQRVNSQFDRQNKPSLIACWKRQRTEQQRLQDAISLHFMFNISH